MAETITVTQLNSRAKQIISSSPAICDIWVTGEISGLKSYPSGYYLTLKDEGAAVSAVMFKNAVSRLDFVPKENMKVVAYGSAGLYPQRGTFQFIIESMRQSGVGDLYRRFEELKARLREEGLFEESRKRSLPKYPKVIGVVTSASGAVIHDIITTSSSRYPVDILLAPAQVQGEGAAKTIVAGIEALNRQGVDIIIVGRGGGSIEDLWPFNEESVARAIAASAVPVVSAVGHETDFTIADFVADLRAPTPTGAAAMILRDKAEIMNELSAISVRMDRSIRSKTESMRKDFSSIDSRLSPEHAMEDIGMHRMALENLSNRLDSSLAGTIARMRNRFDLADVRLRPSSALDDIGGKSDRADTVMQRISSSVSSVIEKGRLAHDSYCRQLVGLNPYRILERGYGMVTDPEGRVLTSVDGLSVGSTVKVLLRDGTATTEVKQLEERI